MKQNKALFLFGYSLIVCHASLFAEFSDNQPQTCLESGPSTFADQSWLDDQDYVLVDDYEINDDAPLTRGHGCKAFGSLRVTNCLRAGSLSVYDNAVINGDLTVNGKIITDGGKLDTTDHAVQVGTADGNLRSLPLGTNGQVLIGSSGADPVFSTLTSPDGSIVPTGGAGTLSLQSTPLFGNTLRVDAVYGNDATATANPKLPFLTIEAAIAAASSGDTIWIFPGLYTPTIPLIIPTGVSILGLTSGDVTITYNASVATDLVTMGENSRLENVTLILTSNIFTPLRGIVFPGTTTATAKIYNVTLTVDNSGAGGAGSSTVYGISATGTGTPGEQFATMRASTITVISAGAGLKRGISIDNVNDFHMRDSNVVVTNTGTGSAIGVETSVPGALFTARASTISGTNTSVPSAAADISQTASNSTITIVDTDLLNANANGLGFTTEISPSIVEWGTPGLLLTTTGFRFLTLGTTGVFTTNTQSARVPQPLIIKSLSVRALTAPGAGLSTTFTLFKNGVATPLAATLGAADLQASNNAVTVSCTTGDILAMQATTVGPGNATSFNVVSVELY